MMGTAQAEIDRLCKEYPDGAAYFKREAPQHKVTIAKPFAVGRYALTFGEFSAFVDETGYDPPDKLYNYGYSEKDLSFRNPGFPQEDSHPVVGVHWKDARAYTKWLSGKTGKGYRPLSEAEWEYACRAGTQSPFWWGSSISTEQANYNRKYGFGGGNEGQYGTVPVKSFSPNPWGFYQVHGNVSEWCEEIYSDYNWWETYSDCNSGDGGAWRVGIGSSGTVRGGSWSDDPVRLRAACRIGELILPTNRSGFRLARTL